MSVSLHVFATVSPLTRNISGSRAVDIGHQQADIGLPDSATTLEEGRVNFVR